MSRQTAKLAKVREAMINKYGKEYVHVDEHDYRLNVVPTGSLMLDYKTGIGGFPYGHAVEVFGVNRLGKSSAIGYPVLGNVQKAGGVPAVIASEPRLVTPGDREWALKLGFDPDMAHILYPDHEEDAFLMLRDLVFNDLVDYIMIDSLGGLGNKSGAKQDGKQKSYGISGAATSAFNDIMPRLYKNNIGLLVINQARQSGSFNGHTMYESPGGEALKHHARIRIQMKPGEGRFVANVDNEKVMVGRELICQFRKNSLSQGQEKTAAFNFFHIETGTYPFGIDTAQDIVNVGKITGILKGGAWLHHDSFPADKKGEHKLNGKDAVGQYLTENPEAMAQVRNDVLAVMVKDEMQKAAEKREELQEAEVSEETDE